MTPTFQPFAVGTGIAQALIGARDSLEPLVEVRRELFGFEVAIAAAILKPAGERGGRVAGAGVRAGLLIGEDKTENGDVGKRS